MLENLYNSLKYAGIYTQFLEIAEASGFIEKLKSYDNFTVFAPSDESIKNLNTNTIKLMFNDTQKLFQLASCHIVPGVYNINLLSSLQAIDYENISIKISKVDSDIYINNAKIISYDHEATNGIFHEVDALMIPKDKI